MNSYLVIFYRWAHSGWDAGEIELKTVIQAPDFHEAYKLAVSALWGLKQGKHVWKAGITAIQQKEVV